MPTAGKKVVDEFYIHLSAVEEVEDTAIREAIGRTIGALPQMTANEPNVAKVNVRTGRVSLLSYPDFFESPFPALAASWVFQAGASAPSWHRTYGDSLNPPILHRKELLLSSLHPEHDRWARITATAEELGLFDDVATIACIETLSKGYVFRGQGQTVLVRWRTDVQVRCPHALACALGAATTSHKEFRCTISFDARHWPCCSPSAAARPWRRRAASRCA